MDPNLVHHKIPGFPGYMYCIEEKKLFSQKSGKYLPFKRECKFTKAYGLRKDGKEFHLNEAKLDFLITGKERILILPGMGIPNFPLYNITQDGVIYNRKTGRKLRSAINKGYHICGLSRDGKVFMRSVHRLVAETYIQNPSNLPIVNHRDLNRLNNHLSNLEWCSQRENVIHGIAAGSRKVEGRAVIQYEIIQKEGDVLIFDSMMEASRTAKLGRGPIWKACKTGKPSGGYYWSYADPDSTKRKYKKIRAVKIAIEEKKVREYTSTEGAARTLGISGSSITAVCVGRTYTAGGFKFRYVDEREDAKIGQKGVGDWKVIPNFSKYRISPSGDIFSLFVGRKIRQSKSGGYKRVLLIQDNGAKKSFYVHRLVALVYLENPDGKPVVNHINGKKDDNRVINLEWSTYRENSRHAVRTGLRKRTLRSVIQYGSDGVEITRFPSITSAAANIGVSGSGIGRVCQGRGKTCGGFVWRYV